MTKITIFLMSLILLLTLAACGGTAEDVSTDTAVVADTIDTAVSTTEDDAPAADVAEAKTETEMGTETAVALTEDYAEDALPIRTQLLIGTLKLEGADLAVTPEQASELLVLWQASSALSRSGTGATEEVTAILNQIEGAMTPQQITAIAEMQLTRENIQTMAQELGISSGGDGTGPGGANRGQGQNMTEEEKAAREAERVERASNGASNALLDMLIEILTSRSQQ